MGDTWEPESLKVAVGDRVTVRLSGECKTLVGHEPTTHGKDGFVYDVLPENPLNYGHRYMVRFDQNYFVDGKPHYLGQFARAELERHGKRGQS